MSSEVRTTSSTGGQKGVKAERHDLLPRPALDAIAQVYAFGAEKYADHNWRRGYEWGKSYAALQRHLTAFWDGETLDEESGLPHLAHAGFHVFALLTWLAEQGEGEDNPFDDRWLASMQRADRDKLEAEGQSFAAVLTQRFIMGGDPSVHTWQETAAVLAERDAVHALRLRRPVEEWVEDRGRVIHSSDIPVEDLRI